MENSMQHFFSWLLCNSWQAAILVVLVWVAQRLFGYRLPPRWRCRLWLLVAVRLVLPAAPESRLSIFTLFGRAAHLRTVPVQTDPTPPGTDAFSGELARARLPKDGLRAVVV